MADDEEAPEEMVLESLTTDLTRPTRTIYDYLEQERPDAMTDRVHCLERLGGRMFRDMMTVWSLERAFEERSRGEIRAWSGEFDRVRDEITKQVKVEYNRFVAKSKAEIDSVLAKERARVDDRFKVVQGNHAEDIRLAVAAVEAQQTLVTEKLDERVMALEKRLENAEDRATRAEDALTLERAASNSLRQRCDETDAKFDALSSDLRRTEAALDSALAEKVDPVYKTVTDLSHRLQRLVPEPTTTTTTILSITEVASLLEMLLGRAAVVEAEAHKSQREVDALAVRVSQEMTASEDARETLRHRLDAVEAVDVAKIANIAITVDDLKRQVEDQTTTTTALEGTVSKLRFDHDAGEDRLKSEIDKYFGPVIRSVEEDVNSLKVIASTTEDRLETLDQRTAETTKDLDSVRETMETTKATIADVENVSSSVDAVSRSMASLNDRLRDAEHVGKESQTTGEKLDALVLEVARLKAFPTSTTTTTTRRRKSNLKPIRRRSRLSSHSSSKDPAQRSAEQFYSDDQEEEVYDDDDDDVDQSPPSPTSPFPEGRPVDGVPPAVALHEHRSQWKIPPRPHLRDPDIRSPRPHIRKPGSLAAGLLRGHRSPGPIYTLWEKRRRQGLGGMTGPRVFVD